MKSIQLIVNGMGTENFNLNSNESMEVTFVITKKIYLREDENFN